MLKQKNLEEKSKDEREFLKLNRLESYLLKLVIPFIRIAHCPRGRYFKVKGDLILISSDITHSLSKILPLQQSLIPVCFKRKLAYSGSFIEEFIEKEKVQMYFSWFKENNHLYKDISLDAELIDQFTFESQASSDEFESKTKEDGIEVSVDVKENEDNSLGENVVIEEGFENAFEIYQVNDEVEKEHNQTTMFMNKYCEDPNLPTVANKLADMIVDYEMKKKYLLKMIVILKLMMKLYPKKNF